MMPINQNLSAMPSAQGMVSVPTSNLHQDMRGAHLVVGMSQQQQHPGIPLQVTLEPAGFNGPVVHSAGSNTSSNMPYSNPLTSTDTMTAFTPMVPSMQPAVQMSATTTPMYTPPEGVMAALADPSKRHRRHPSSGRHSPELRMIFQKQDFFQQQQQKMAAKEQALFENLRRVEVEAHQSRSPRTAAAAGLKINVSDIQARAMPPLSALASPNESGHAFSPGPLSGPSPTMGPVNNSLMDTIMEVSSNFQLQNLNDPQPMFPTQEIKTESMEVLDPPSTRSELAELSKQELIEKVMEYERQMEGSLPARRMSNAKAEMADKETVSEAPTVPQVITSPHENHQRSQTLTFSPTPNGPSSLPTPQFVTGALEAPKDDASVKQSTSPQLKTQVVKSPKNASASAAGNANDDEEDDEGDDDDEDNEDEIEDEDNEDDTEGAAPRAGKGRKGSLEAIDSSATDSETTPSQLVCLWRDCNTPFETMEQLNEHVTENHIGSGKACYSCDWQGCHRQQKPFTKRHKMYNHLRTHTGERPFKCLVPGCDKKFSRPDSLTTHTKTHSNVRPYVCQVEGCTKAYYHARSLKKHELAHEAKRVGSNKALRGPGSNVNVTQGSSAETGTGAGSATGTQPQPQHQQHSHFSHPYLRDYTASSGRASKHHGHQRQLSQTPSFNLAMASDPAMPQGLISASAMSSGANSPSPAAIAGLSAGFNPAAITTILKPPMSNHSSSSSVPSLSMVMSGTSLTTLEEQAIVMNPAFQQLQQLQNQGTGTSGVTMSSNGTSLQGTPTGSPGFQSNIASNSTMMGHTAMSPSLNNTGSSNMTLTMPMSVEVTMNMPVNPMDGQTVSSPQQVLSTLPQAGGVPVNMVLDQASFVNNMAASVSAADGAVNGSTVYMLSNDPQGQAQGQGTLPPPVISLSGVDAPTSAPGPVSNQIPPTGPEQGFNVGMPTVSHAM
ncbi:hypothetical protein BGZ51_007614 [Haplosporangium sp. Z 767]|nr:hypothetical protein BGZ51_007614 [Haplosporangium sp. Z 767]